MRIINRRAKYNYYLLDRFEAGIALSGPEVKSVKEKKVRLDESFIRLAQDGAFLVNTHIACYPYANQPGYDPRRSRRLLLHKKQILALTKKIEGKNLTLVPVSCYTKKGKIKLEIALARGKKKWDKREAIKRRDLEREVEKELKVAK